MYFLAELILLFYPNQIVAIIILTSQTVTSLQGSSWILLYHFSYYILAHRIKVLRLYLSEDVELDPKVPESGCTISTIPETEVVVVDR